MGYNMRLRDARFSMKAEQLPAAFAALKALFQKQERCFWRIDSDEVRAAATFPEMMAACRWPVTLDDQGNVTGIYFRGEKRDDDELIFQAIAPYVDADSRLDLAGEEGWTWCWEFDGSAMH